MPLETARDIMIPLDHYAVVDEDATMVEALHALERAQHLVPPGKHAHRAVLVRGAGGAIIGKLGHHSFLAGLEPRYLAMGDASAFSRKGYTKEYLRSMMEQVSLWQSDFATYVQRAMTTTVAEVMHPLEEHVDVDAPIGEVIHKLLMYSALSLVVTADGQPVGMVRLADLFTVVAKNIKRRAGAQGAT